MGGPLLPARAAVAAPEAVYQRYDMIRFMEVYRSRPMELNVFYPISRKVLGNPRLLRLSRAILGWQVHPMQWILEVYHVLASSSPRVWTTACVELIPIWDLETIRRLSWLLDLL